MLKPRYQAIHFTRPICVEMPVPCSLWLPQNMQMINEHLPLETAWECFEKISNTYLLSCKTHWKTDVYLWDLHFSIFQHSSRCVSFKVADSSIVTFWHLVILEVPLSWLLHSALCCGSRLMLVHTDSLYSLAGQNRNLFTAVSTICTPHVLDSWNSGKCTSVESQDFSC